MFLIGDKITHPMHGAGIIEEVIEKRVEGAPRRYFLMRMSYGDMTVLVPSDSCESIGVRSIISDEQAEQLISSFGEIVPDEIQNWNKRYRDNMVKIKSGDLYQVAQVVKGLLIRDREKGLSTGERKLLSSAKQILVSEISLAKGLPIREIENIINTKLI